MPRSTPGNPKTPFWLFVFCYALMGPACAINGAFIALAIPAVAKFGIEGLLVAGVLGAVVGILPALWLARRIHEGIRDDR
jgi:hypothetical protein